MKKIIIFLLVAAIIAGLALTAFKFFGPPGPAGEEGGIHISEITLGNVESVVTAQGTLEPKDYVEVGAQVSGSIMTMYVDLGDNVEKGDLIVEIDPDVYESQVRGDEANLKTLMAQKTEQDALLRQAERKYLRNKRLMESKAISEETFEDAETDYEVAKASLAYFEAQIEKAESDLEADKTNLSYTKIYAPMSGTVVSQEVTEGQTINANQSTPEIVQISNLDVMTVKGQVAEADIMNLETGMEMYFTTLGSNGRRWYGTVRQILPEPETINDVVLYNVLVDIDNKDRQLMSGMTTQMFFILGKAENAPIVQVSALTKRAADHDTEEGMAYEVKVLTPKGPENRIVITGVSDRTNAEVISGLEVGDKVLVSSSHSISSSENKEPMRMPRL